MTYIGLACLVAHVSNSAHMMLVGHIRCAEGPAVAHNYILRGFDAEQGQDIEFRVGGLPINMPSYIHGQGYADLGFLIGRSVREMRITEGACMPRGQISGTFFDTTMSIAPAPAGARRGPG